MTLHNIVTWGGEHIVDFFIKQGQEPFYLLHLSTRTVRRKKKIRIIYPTTVACTNGNQHHFWKIQCILLQLTDCSATLVCASNLPLTEVPVWTVIAVCPRTTPSRCECVPSVTAWDTTQMMFDACAPPRRVVRTPVARPKVPEIWNIQAVRCCN